MTLRPTDSSALLIDGKLVPGAGGVFDVIDPATEEVLEHAAEGTESDMDAAIAAARHAFDDTTGPAITPFARGVCGNCATRCSPTSRSSARSPSPRSVHRRCSRRAPSSKARSPTCGTVRTGRVLRWKPISG